MIPCEVCAQPRPGREYLASVEADDPVSLVCLSCRKRAATIKKTAYLEDDLEPAPPGRCWECCASFETHQVDRRRKLCPTCREQRRRDQTARSRALSERRRALRRKGYPRSEAERELTLAALEAEEASGDLLQALAHIRRDPDGTPAELERRERAVDRARKARRRLERASRKIRKNSDSLLHD